MAETLECPYCEHKHTIYELEEIYEGEDECELCGKPFIYWIDQEVRFSVRSQTLESWLEKEIEHCAKRVRRFIEIQKEREVPKFFIMEAEMYQKRLDKAKERLEKLRGHRITELEPCQFCGGITQ